MENKTLKIDADVCCDVIFSVTRTSLDIQAKRPIQVTLKDGTLKIITKERGIFAQPDNGSTLSYIAGAVRDFFSSSNTPQIAKAGDLSVSVSKDTVAISGTGMKKLVIDEKEIDMSSLKVLDKKNDEFKGCDNYGLAGYADDKVTHVTMNGNGKLIFKDNVFAKNLTLEVKDSRGSICLPELCSFDNLQAKIVGAGKIDLASSVITNADVNIIGSGNVANMHAVQKCKVNMIGTGMVSGTTSNICDYMQNNTGSGTIDVIRNNY